MLAIVIPYYKLTFFEETLQSLGNQTDLRFKVYIGDDASPENPEILLEKFKEQFDFVYHRFENNLGGISLTQQWDRCIALSNNEEWIMILGDDDYLGNLVVESWYKNYNIFYKKAEVIRFTSKMVVEETKKVSEVFTHPVWEAATDSYYRKLEHLTRSSLSEYIFSRASYRKYGFYDYPLAWNSDDRAWLDFSDNKPIFTINESVVYFRLSALNISGKEDNKVFKSLSQIVFYEFILLNKLSNYNICQQDRIMRKYEKEIKMVRNLNLKEFVLLLFCYLRYFNFDSFKKFIKRSVKQILVK